MEGLLSTGLTPSSSYLRLYAICSANINIKLLETTLDKVHNQTIMSVSKITVSLSTLLYYTVLYIVHSTKAAR